MLLVLCNSECVLTFVGNKEMNEKKKKDDENYGGRASVIWRRERARTAAA